MYVCLQNVLQDMGIMKMFGAEEEQGHLLDLMECGEWQMGVVSERGRGVCVMRYDMQGHLVGE